MANEKVKVKLAGDSYVDGAIRKAGEEVEVPKDIAAEFGTVVKGKKEEPAKEE